MKLLAEIQNLQTQKVNALAGFVESEIRRAEQNLREYAAQGLKELMFQTMVNRTYSEGLSSTEVSLISDKLQGYFKSQGFKIRVYRNSFGTSDNETFYIGWG